MRLSRLLGVALVLAACTPTPPGGAQSSSPTSSPAASGSLVPTATVTAASPALPTFAVDPSAPWPVVLYEADGGVIRERTASTVKDIARPCTQIHRLDARPAGLLVSCRSGSPERDDIYLVSVPDGQVRRVASDVHGSWPPDISFDGRSIVAGRLGACASPAPVCPRRAVLIDVVHGTEREIAPSGYHPGARLEWTALGPTLFQPECAEAGCAGPAGSGTFFWDGSALKKWSDLRFVSQSGDWTLLERLRSFFDRSDQRAAIVRGPQGERTLSAGHALAISSSGETLVWQPGPELLIRYAPDGRALWQASLAGDVLKAIGMDALLVSSAANKIEIYDLKRMLRFTPSLTSFTVAAVAR